MFRRKPKDQAPLHPDSTDTNQRILDTLKSFDFDPQEVMLVGSAALTLYGVELRPFQGPNDDPQHLKARPADVDLAASSAYMEAIYRDGAPHGQRFKLRTIDEVHNAQTIIRSEGLPGSNLLPVELISRFRPARTSQDTYDNKFREHIARVSRPLADTAFRVITLEHVIKDLSASARYEPKAQQDMVDIRRRINQL